MVLTDLDRSQHVADGRPREFLNRLFRPRDEIENALGKNVFDSSIIARPGTLYRAGEFPTFL